jgi:hypothetical protein
MHKRDSKKAVKWHGLWEAIAVPAFRANANLTDGNILGLHRQLYELGELDKRANLRAEIEALRLRGSTGRKIGKLQFELERLLREKKGQGIK